MTGGDAALSLEPRCASRNGVVAPHRLTRVRAEVVAATKGKQVPWSNSSLLGEVYLAEK
jgi:uncharacterized caspase-like protein